LLGVLRMLHKVKDLQGDTILAEDGEVGSFDDLYFDDVDWDVHYLVVNARRLKPERKYLVSPVSIDRERTLSEGDLHVELTCEQISQCPIAEDSDLCSSADVIGCGIEALDGTVGRVTDLVVDDENWAITDVLVDSRQWLPGKVLLISPDVIERIDRRRRKVHLRLARADILRAPEVEL
jgi:sporulation protein YlmC with PRC-barrel domain